MILAHVAKKEINDVSIMTVELTPTQQKQLENIVFRRIQHHEPLDKILGQKAFYKYNFLTNSDVLSPRPETEVLLEAALELTKNKTASILDLGTGSGCLLLSLLKENPSAKGYGVDISEKALRTAKQNAARLDVKHVKWIKADWFSPDFKEKFREPFDLIVSNPPYIPNADIAALESEVKDHDPFVALSGGDDGYASYYRLSEIVPQLLKNGGHVLLECGKGQAKRVADIFTTQNLVLCNILKDLQGIERCIILKK